jgi:hypothetical protein
MTYNLFRFRKNSQPKLLPSWMSSITKIRLVFTSFLLLLIASPSSAQRPFELPRASPTASVSQTFGYSEATLVYCRPGVRERKVWGGLVPFGKVWRTGANEATTFEITTDVKVGGKPLAKGKYSLHMIPTEKEWTFIFNREANAWGSYAYDEKKDVMRVKTAPFDAPMEERLTFGFETLTDTSATLFLHWDKKKARLPLVVETLETAKAKIKDGLPKAKPDDMFSWLGAARFYHQHGIDDKQAWEWLEKSLTVQLHHANQWEKAQWLYDEGKSKEAVTWAGKARIAADKAGEAGMVANIDEALKNWAKSGK